MDNNIPLLLQKAEAGDPTAQYALAKHYGRMIQDAETVEDTHSYSKQAMMWLKRAAMQGYQPAKEALDELKKETLEFSSGSPAESEDRPAPDVRPAPDTASRSGTGEGQTGPAVKNSSSSEAPSEDSVIAPPVFPKLTPPIPESYAPANPEEYPEDDYAPAVPLFGAAGVVAAVLLIISLIANAVLGYMLIRSKNADDKIPPSSPPVSDGIDLPIIDSPEPASNTGSDENIGDNVEVIAPVEPVIDENELPISEELIDLAQLRRLDFIPAEIYAEFVYYTVQTDGYDLNIRKGPGTNYDAIGSIPTGTQVGVAAESGEWYLACYDGTYGWVSGAYLRR